MSPSRHILCLFYNTISQNATEFTKQRKSRAEKPARQAISGVWQFDAGPLGGSLLPKEFYKRELRSYLPLLMKKWAK